MKHDDLVGSLVLVAAIAVLMIVGFLYFKHKEKQILHDAYNVGRIATEKWRAC